MGACKRKHCVPADGNITRNVTGICDTRACVLVLVLVLLME